MRFVHISDIHSSVMPRSAGPWFDKRALGALNHLLRRKRHVRMEYLARAVTRIRSLAPDWVVITGDLTSIGSPDEFDLVLESLRPLREGPAAIPCIFVPGNHDAYVRNPAADAALRKAFGLLNGGRWEMDALPVEIEFPCLSVFVLDECRPTLPWLSTGRLTPAACGQFQAWASRSRRENEKRLLIGHYPCRLADGRRIDWRRRLEDDRLIQAAFDARQIDAALCGHCHTPFLRAESGGAMEICAGALTVHGRINVLDFSPLTGRFSQCWEDVSGNGHALIPIGAVTAAPG